MSTRRVKLGNMGGGVYGLRCSLPGYDVVTDDPTDPSKFSFNSDWTNIAKINTVGIIYVPSFSGGTNISVDAFITNNGYIPFAEVRYISGNTIYDDYNPYSVGLPGWIVDLKVDRLTIHCETGGDAYLAFLAYNIEAPSQ